MTLLYKFIYKIIRTIGGLFFIFNFLRVDKIIYFIWSKFYTGYKSVSFKYFGCSSFRPRVTEIWGEKYIEVGDKVSLGKGISLTATDNFKGQVYMPSIVIGSNVSIGDYSHISAINKIVIKDGVLTGKYVTIVDNSHGLADMSESDIAPTFRKLSSKGPVIIEENVWIGEKASIMPGVTVGKGSIVAANAVVTKNVPPYSLVAGVPAKIIKQVNQKKS